jgi:uncharacterized membrane protein YphA (DoxX/SURF4 family)
MSRTQNDPTALRIVNLFTRLALSSAFLSAVADRFGLWGAPGSAHASWGDFSHFITYTAQVISFLPASLAPAAAWLGTIAEIVFGIGILIPGRTSGYFALGSGVLLLLYALAMCAGSGVKSALEYSVFTASGAAFLLSFTVQISHLQVRWQKSNSGRQSERLALWLSQKVESIIKPFTGQEGEK